MKVPFLDLQELHRPLHDELMDALAGVVGSDDYVLGPAVESFEAAFAAYVGRRYCVAVSSGTAALHLALRVAGVGPGDEVVTTPLTWISTSWAISYCGARPVFVDVEPSTGNIDPSIVNAAINARTRAMVPVDLYGNPCRLDQLEELAAGRNIRLVDDACQAHGSRLENLPVGSYGDLACFSFYPGKNLGGLGEGGAVVTDDGDTAQGLRQLRDHGQYGRHNHIAIGFNYRMDGLQGAALSVKLTHLDRWNAARCRIAARYVAGLRDVPGMTLPEATPGADPNWHLFVIHVEMRDPIRELLEELGIETGVHYPTPIHLQPVYEGLGYQRGDFPVAEHLAATCLSLPMSPVMTESQQEAVLTAVRTACAKLL